MLRGASLTLEEALATWVAERPDGQKDAIARLCRNEVLSDDDVAAIPDHLIAGTHPSVAGSPSVNAVNFAL